MRIAVFLGSSPGPDHHRAAAAGLGRAIAEAGHGLVYGGAHVGLMGVLADAAWRPAAKWWACCRRTSSRARSVTPD